jgi:hypothetical protein
MVIELANSKIMSAMMYRTESGNNFDRMFPIFDPPNCAGSNTITNSQKIKGMDELDGWDLLILRIVWASAFPRTTNKESFELVLNEYPNINKKIGTLVPPPPTPALEHKILLKNSRTHPPI